MPGGACPACGKFAQREPGALRCLTCGYSALILRILPFDHPSRAYNDAKNDWRNRARQVALDRGFVKAGRVPEFIFDMLARLEGSHRADAASSDTVTPAPPPPLASVPVPA